MVVVMNGGLRKPACSVVARARREGRGVERECVCVGTRVIRENVRLWSD